MRLIAEARFGRDLGKGHPLDDAIARRMHPAAGEVRMRRDPEGAAERLREAGGARIELARRGRERRGVKDVRVQPGAEMIGEAVHWLAVGRHTGDVAVREPDPISDHCQPRLGLERIVGAGKRVVQRGDHRSQARIRDRRPIDRRADEALAKDVGLEIENPLAETGSRRGPTVVDDVRRQDGNHCPVGAPGPATEVVPDRAVIHDEQRPGVMRVRRVRVLPDRGVKDLADPRNARVPCPDRGSVRALGHRMIVQDHPAAPAQHHAMDEVLALVGFSFLSAATPGPNNVLLWASGARFGVRRTLPHVLGTALGLGGMALAAAAGLAGVVAASPGVALLMKAAGSAYLLYLAWGIARSGMPAAGTTSRPLGVVAAATFQALNPKAWIFALGAVTTFAPSALPPATAGLVVAATMMLVIVPSALVWAVAGGALAGLMERDPWRTLVPPALGLLLVATVATVWL